jgi:MYXO-CTERM domain-containing protein
VNTGNSGITGSGGLIKNSVTFTLDGAGAGFDLNRIHNVFLQYGTALDEPGYSVTPSPGVGSVLAFAGLVAVRRRRN